MVEKGKYPADYRKELRLRGGESILLRNIGVGDHERMIGFHKRLSELTVRMRYFETMSLEARTDRARLERICNPQLDREIAIVAVVDDEIVGVGRLEDGLSMEKAEFAVLLVDDWQGRGLGGVMLKELIELAKKRGLVGIHAEIMPSNRGMRKLVKGMGFRVLDDYEEKTAFVTLDFYEGK